SEVNLLRGLVAVARKDRARARDAFRLAYALVRERRQLDRAIYRPQVVELYAEAIRKPVATGRLAVSSVPAGATILVDGEAVGSAPAHLPALAAGDRSALVTADGYHAGLQERHVRPGAGLELLYALIPHDC